MTTEINDKRPVIAILAWMLSSPIYADDQIPQQFQGTWHLDVEATTLAIEADESLPAEMANVWAEQKNAIIEYDRIISADTITTSMRIKGRDEQRDGVPERGANQVEYDADKGGFMVFVMRQDPRHCPTGCTPEQERFFHLRIREDGSLQVRESRMSGWDRSDPLLRSMVFRKPDGAVTGNDAVAYLDALKSCTPGEHRFSYAGLGNFENTIQGQGDAGCRVNMVANGIRLQCEFSAETIELLTRPEKYEDARNGVLQGSTDSEESIRMNEECEFDAS